MEDQRTEFSKKVIELILAVPEGKVATYGLIAALAGKPQGSRGVGWLLHSSTQKRKLPWQRILKSSGKLAFPKGSSGYTRQRTLLEAEGIVFKNDGVDLKKYLWSKKPQADKAKSKKSTPTLFTSTIRRMFLL